MVEFDAAMIRSLLEELGRRLDAAGVRATIYLVGGAAMALEFDQRRVTADVDAIFEPEATVEAAAQELAEEQGLPPDWLNAAARPWVPGSDTGRVVFESDGLAVTVASPEHLLAMKMAASRPQDIRDLMILFEHLGIEAPEEAADIAEHVYGPDSMQLTQRADLLLTAREVLSRIASSGPGGDRR